MHKAGVAAALLWGRKENNRSLAGAIYTGGQKFGILRLISLSLINKNKKSKYLCLVKFEGFCYNDKQNLLRILSISDPQVSLNRLGCAKKMTELRSIAVWGHRVSLYICLTISL